MDYDNLQCEIVKNDKIDHNISFKIVVVGNAGKRDYNSQG